MADETTTTSAEELVPVEDIDTYIANFNYVVPSGLAVAWARPSIGSIPVRFPRWNEISVPSGTKNEAEDFTRVEVTTTEASATPGLVGFEVVLTDELLAGAQGGVPESLLQQGVRAILGRMNSDVLGVSTGATNATGSTSDALGREKFSAAAAAYRALEIDPGATGLHAAILAHGPMGELDKDEVLTSAAIAGKSMMDVMSATSGYKGRYGGFELFEDGAVANEAPGKSNIMTPIGAQVSGLGLAMTEMPRVARARAELGNRAAADFYVLRAWYGASLAYPQNLLEVLSAA